MPMRSLLLVVLCALIGLVGLGQFGLPGIVHAEDKQTAPAKSAAPGISYEKQILPLLKQYCVNCHGGARPRASFSLDKILTDAQASDSRKIWDKVIRVTQAREMPPEEKPQLTPAERDLLLQYLDQQLAAVDCTKGTDPGRVTIRRLNRTEYNNTIHDLVGITFRPADDFPADDVGYGFDNIGDVLTLSPLLLEKYLAAAERIADQVVDAARIAKKPDPPVRLYARSDLRNSTGMRTDRTRGQHILERDGEVFASHTFRTDGEHLFRIRASSAGKEPVRFALMLEGKELKSFDAPPGRPGSFEFRVPVKPGTRRFAVTYRKPAGEGAALHVFGIQIQAPAEEGIPESYRRIFLGTSKDKSQDPDAARTIVAEFARRAFRRPVEPREVDRYLKLYQLAQNQGESFEKSIGLALQGILVSPHFLFRIEKEPAQGKPGSTYSINEFELATRLSYFLWSTMPDEELFALAQKGQLRANLESQVRRMLKDDRAKALVQNFGGQWLELKNLKTLNPDRGVYPGFDEQLRAAMVTEGEMFFEAILREDRSVLTFLDADFTFVNGRLARHYGLPDVYGPEFRKVQLPKTSVRGGVLTMGSMLTLTSNPTRTSPVKRGKWILENILNTPPPPAPPNVPELEEEKKVAESAPLRQRMEMHRTRADCISCHARMDPLGFALENFDGVGGWRDRDGKFPVDASGELPSGDKFDGPRGLKRVLLAQSDKFVRCLAEKMLTYALGRGTEYQDKCAVEDIATALTKDGYKFSRLVVAIVQSDAFQKRKISGGNTGS